MPPLPVPATDPKAKKLFHEAVGRYAKLKNLTVSYNKNLLQFTAPSTAKMTILNRRGEVAVVQAFNNKESIVMQKPNDVYEYVATPLKPLAKGKSRRSRMATSGIGGIVFPKLLAGTDPFGEGATYKASSYTMAAPIALDGASVVPVTVTTIRGDKQKFDLTYVFYIGEQDKLFHKIEARVKSDSNGQTRVITDTFKDYKINSKLRARELAFTAPAGAVKMEKFTMPAVRAKVGEMPLALPVGTKDLEGKELTFDQFKGKVTLVDFWATWCMPCVAELPNVKANYEKYKDQGFDVVGVSLDQSTDPLTKFIKEKQVPWRQVFDGQELSPIATAYNVQFIPATVLIGKDGKVAAIGASGEELEPAIKAALAAE